MYGGNPNAARPQPLSAHHMRQQSGTHNNFGIGGIAPGRSTMQAPAKGLHLNSLASQPSVHAGPHTIPMQVPEQPQQLDIWTLLQLQQLFTPQQQPLRMFPRGLGF